MKLLLTSQAQAGWRDARIRLSGVTLGLVAGFSGALMALLVTVAAAAPAPGALYRALLVKPFPIAQLPEGFASPHVTAFAVSATSKRHHAIGGVRVKLNGGRDWIEYVVFPTHGDALAEWRSAVTAGDGQMWSGTGSNLPSLPQPSRLYLGIESTQGSSTSAIFASGAVLVRATTKVLTGAVHFNQAATVSLARSVNAHLIAVQR